MLLLILVDTYTKWLEPARGWLADAAMPFYWVTNIPARIGEWGDDKVISRAELEADRQRLTTELLIHQGRLQRMAEFTAENQRLRNLLNATELLQDSVLVTELIGISPDPTKHTILINRGEVDGVFVGQPVLDADGLMGQVIDVHTNSSRVLLITDSSHALPVQIVRNGVRSIAEGVGDYGRLRLRYVSPTTDIQVDDVLVSSGLGQRYPVGYPVGKVVAVEVSPGEPYAEVELIPTARLDRSRHLLLVFSAVEKLGG